MRFDGRLISPAIDPATCPPRFRSAANWPALVKSARSGRLAGYLFDAVLSPAGWLAGAMAVCCHGGARRPPDPVCRCHFARASSITLGIAIGSVVDAGDFARSCDGP